MCMHVCHRYSLVSNFEVLMYVSEKLPSHTHIIFFQICEVLNITACSFCREPFRLKERREEKEKEKQIVKSLDSWRPATPLKPEKLDEKK